MSGELIGELYKSNLIQRGEFKLKNGEISEYYFNMKNLISYPKLLIEVTNKLFNLTKDIEYDLLCGVPLGGIPLACQISIKNNIPLIIPRTEKKKYGMKKQIEGKYNKLNKCIIIEDVITTGQSVKEIIDLLENKVEIVGIITIINRNEIEKIGKYNIKYLLSGKDI